MDNATNAPDGQQDIVAFLSDPATYGSDGPVETITTHSAHVFLVGARACKIKRAVRYNYLDFTSLESRRRVLERELELNRPAAPMIYDRVVPVTREACGRLALDGAGAPVEYVLCMNRFDREKELTRIAEAGGLTDALAGRLGLAVADLHGKAATRDAGGAELIGEIIEELRDAFAGMEDTLGAARLAAWFEGADARFDDLKAVLDRRSREGFVRRCHGDLHLKNLVLIEGEVVPFDALEFDERLGTCDVFYDFAFLVMDLLHRGLDGQANTVLNAYLRKTRDHEGLSALPLFLSVRAAIRSMVAVQTMSGTVADAAAREARAYLEEAIAYLAPPPARLVAVGGLSGTGKTTVARRLAPGLGAAPGAVHLRSDLERKAMFGVAPEDRLPQDAYAPDVSEAVYARLTEAAASIVGSGHAAILDATFLDAGERDAVAALAGRLGVALEGVWLTADAAVLEARVAAREGDASDADVAVLHGQLSRQDTAPAGWTVVDAGGSPDEVAARVATMLSRP